MPGGSHQEVRRLACGRSCAPDIRVTRRLQRTRSFTRARLTLILLPQVLAGPPLLPPPPSLACVAAVSAPGFLFSSLDLLGISVTRVSRWQRVCSVRSRAWMPLARSVDQLQSACHVTDVENALHRPWRMSRSRHGPVHCVRNS